MDWSYEAIKDRMVSRLTNPSSKVEGCIIMDTLQAVAYELAEFHAIEIEGLVNETHLSTAVEEENIIAACEDENVYRLPAYKSGVILTITGRAGIYDKVIVSADDILFQTDRFSILNDNDTVNVYAECLEAGTIGNVAAGSITEIVSDVALDSVTNEKAADGGSSQETIESYRKRTMDIVKEPPTGGNMAQYRQWALSVGNVGAVRCFDVQGTSTTIEIVLVEKKSDGTMQEASEYLINKVREYINSIRPAGAIIEITSAKRYPVELSVKAVLKTGYSEEMVTQNIKKVFGNYLSNLIFQDNLKEDEIMYLDIYEQIKQAEGIDKISDYTVNGDKENIVMDMRMFPYVGNIILQ